MCIICQKTYSPENITEMDISGCTTVTEIPPLFQLEFLSCNGCINLKTIPYLPSLLELDCSNCTSLTEIPQLPRLGCLTCDGCSSLTNIPQNIELVYSTGCTWLEQNPDYNDNIQKLISTQKIFNRKLSAKKLEKMIPQLTELYYSPGYNGFKKTEQHFIRLSQLCY